MSCGFPESPQEDSKFRPYICPCGKSYLSYPALFTHVKQKHDGKVGNYLFRHQVLLCVLNHKIREVVLVKAKA